MPREDPAIAEALRALNATMISVAPTSHMYTPSPALDRNRAVPALGASLKATSALRTHTRDTISDVMARFEAHGKDADAVAMADQLRFAAPDGITSRSLAATADIPTAGMASGMKLSSTSSDGGAAVTRGLAGSRTLGLGRTAGAHFGSSTLAPDAVDACKRDPTALPVDAEVRELMTRTRGSMSASASMRPKERGAVDTVGVLLGASGVAPQFGTEYRQGLKFTPAMQEAVRTRDMTHALKTDEEKRYQEERIKFSRVTGSTSGGSKPSAGGKAK